MGVGKIDHPVEHLYQDKLSVEAQVKGFADFIMHCETPMAVAIQGAWGSGKTSFVNLVMEEVAASAANADENAFITFNVWQYSQFGMEKQLLTSLLTALTNEIRNGMPKNADKGKKALEDIGRGIRSIGMAAFGIANEYVKGKYEVDVKSNITPVIENFRSNDEIDAVGKLRRNFQIAVDERLGITAENAEKTAHRRLVIFLDDLDRLSPDRAIEVLEILKIFLDCRHCVFLLAVDYDVVVNGVAIKYKGTLSAQKGRDFFEKMIQVVYTMPNSLNYTDRYIAAMLVENGMNRAMSVDFAKLVKAAGKDNPRAIKRLVNSFVLLMRMKYHIEEFRELEQDVALFAVLCLQNICPELYDYLLSCGSELPLELLDRLKWYAFLPSENHKLSDYIQTNLERLNLLDASGKPDAAKRAFLHVFFEQLIECVAQENTEYGHFDYTVTFDEDYGNILRDALSTTCITRLSNRTITSDDSVAFLTINGMYFPNYDGTVESAFEQTCGYLLSVLDDPELAATAEKFRFIKLGGGLPYSIDVIPTGEMAGELNRFMHYLEDAYGILPDIVWYADKAGRRELWSYRAELPNLSLSDDDE